MTKSLLVAIAAICIAAAGLWQLHRATEGLAISRVAIGGTPATVFRPAAPGGPPWQAAVVIAHGFAGSQQLMQPFAVTLARKGFTAITFDFPGHGRNAALLPGGMEDVRKSTDALMSALDEVVRGAGSSLVGAVPLALLGHSMGSNIVLRYAGDHPAVDATVAVSPFAGEGAWRPPRNLLVVDGALEPSLVLDAGSRLIAAAGGPGAGKVAAGETYGDFADGTARRWVIARGVEHIGVLYSADSLAAARDWIAAAFGAAPGGFEDERGRPLALLFGGLVLLAWPLSRALPRLAAARAGAGLRGLPLALAAVVPAVLTPLVLWRLPVHLLPLLIADYLVLHFAVYGAFTVLVMRTARLRRPQVGARQAGMPWRVRLRFVLSVAAALAYVIGVIGLLLDHYVMSFFLTPARAAVTLAMLAGTLPWFLADEWLTRGPSAARGAYPATKVCFLLSLALAVALNMRGLFFLAVIVPAVLLFFVVNGLFSRWLYRQTGHPWVAATVNAISLSWAMAATFPMVQR